MNEQQKQALLDFVRECLWISMVWNDHNFKPELIREKIQLATGNLNLATIDEANELLDLLKAKLDS